VSNCIAMIPAPVATDYHTEESGTIEDGRLSRNNDDAIGAPQERTTGVSNPSDGFGTSELPSQSRSSHPDSGSQEFGNSFNQDGFTPQEREQRAGGNIFLTVMRIRSEEQGGWAGLMRSMTSAASSFRRSSFQPYSRFAPPNRASSGVLPMEAYLWLRKGTCGFPLRRRVWRFFALRALDPAEPRLLWWWRERRAFEPGAETVNGGSRCRGCINLVSDEVEVRALEESTSAFEIWPRGGTWPASASRDNCTLRGSIVLDAEGTACTREEWIECLRAHIRRGITARAATA
jgi:hypothetical protein